MVFCSSSSRLTFRFLNILAIARRSTRASSAIATANAIISIVNTSLSFGVFLSNHDFIHVPIHFRRSMCFAARFVIRFRFLFPPRMCWRNRRRAFCAMISSRRRRRRMLVDSFLFSSSSSSSFRSTLPVSFDVK